MARFLPLLALSAAAWGADFTALLKAVENRYNGAKTLQVVFSEEVTTAARPKRTETGTLSLRKPGRMRWDYTSPRGKIFLVDGKFVYLYSPASNLVHRTKVKESGDMHAPLAFLIGKLDFQRDFARFVHKTEGGDTWIEAEPKSENAPYTKVEFGVTPQYQIRRVRVTGFDQSVLDFAFTQEKLNPPLDGRMFEFQMPAGASLAQEASPQ